MADRNVHRRSAGSIAILLVGLLLAITACSVPSHSAPIVDPNLATGVNQSGRGGQPPPPPNPDSNYYRYHDESTFVTAGYMNAVVSQTSAAVQVSAAKAFMGQGATWPVPQNPNKDNALPVTVVREVGSPKLQTVSGGMKVTLYVDTVGSYDPVTGALCSNCVAATAQSTLSFTVVASGTGSFRIMSAPAGLYMFSSALYNAQNYTAQSIYFWTADGQLVPDLRYLPAWQSPRQQVTQIVTWILNGPSPWMGQQCASSHDQGCWRAMVPTGVSLRDQYVTIDKVTNAFVVNLNATTLSPDQQEAFLVQIRWSLGSIDVDPRSGQGGEQGVELQIANRPQAATGASYTSRNRAAFREGIPVAYAIAGGKVQAVGEVLSSATSVTLYSKDAAAAAQPKAFSAPENKDVKLAAVHMTSSQSDVAIVREVGDKQQLWIDRTPEAAVGKYVQVNFGSPVTSFSRPVWLTQQPDALAVVADGKLYVVTAKNKVMPVSGTSVANMTAFDIGQDGYRIAYVAGGQISVAVLTTSGNPTLSAGMPINIRPDLDEVGSVAWSGISGLVAIGTYGSGGKGYVIETNLDGVVANDGTPRLSETGFTMSATPQIASYPLPPINDSFSAVMLEEESGAYSGRGTLSPMWGSKTTPVHNPFFGN